MLTKFGHCILPVKIYLSDQMHVLYLYITHRLLKKLDECDFRVAKLNIFFLKMLVLRDFKSICAQHVFFRGAPLFCAFNIIAYLSTVAFILYE